MSALSLLHGGAPFLADNLTWPDAFALATPPLCIAAMVCTYLCCSRKR